MGCMCRHCYGLREYMERTTGRDFSALPAAPGHHTPDAGPSCDRSLTCPCVSCERERKARVMKRRPAPPQPWDVRKAA